ncbi:UNVERIFIED_CONTAM: hypothetical protein Sindi_0713500 [Sesamum indicum]
MKVDFINETTVRPPINTDEFKRWNRIDSMVTTWILNRMTKELAESFMYVGSSRELWVELEARYGESNSALIYQLQGEIGQVTQGSQILLLEPLPTVTKAYSMLIRMEKQMQMSLGSMETNSGAAFQGIWTIRASGYMVYRTGIKMGERRKKVMGKGRGYSAMVSDDSIKKSVEGNYSNITELIRQEMKKFMLGETPSDPLQVNFAQLDNFAGSCANSASLISSTWIIDSGATNHICADARLFCSYAELSNTLTIHLPNGHSQIVTHIGSIQLTPNIKLTRVLHIPAFSVNLLSVRQLCASSSIQFTFLTSTCIM